MNFLSLFLIFARIGLFGFGGGIAMLPLIFQSVQKFGIMSKSEFSNLVALSQVTPGPIAVNAATYVGHNVGGIVGAVVATIGVALPSFIIVMLVMKFLEKYKESKGIQGIFLGIRPAVCGLIAAAVIFLAQTVIFEKTHLNIIAGIIFIITVILAGKLKANPIVLTIVMGIIGAFLCG